MMSVFRSMLDLMVPLVLVTPEPTAAQQPANMPETFTGRNASASPDAPELNFRIHSPPAESRANHRFLSAGVCAASLCEMPSLRRGRRSHHRSELQHPAADGLVGNVRVRAGEEIFDVSVAQREPQVDRQ